MHTDRFALGMRLPLVDGAPPEGCLDSLLGAVSPKNMRGLTLHAGTVEDMYVVVIMGGGLSQMRRLYAEISACKAFSALLAPKLSYIGNNRVSHLPELPEIPRPAAR